MICCHLPHMADPQSCLIPTQGLCFLHASPLWAAAGHAIESYCIMASPSTSSCGCLCFPNTLQPNQAPNLGLNTASLIWRVLVQVIPALDPNTPIYAGPFTMQLVRRRLQEFNLFNEKRFHTFKMRTPFQAGPFEYAFRLVSFVCR